MSIHAYEVPPRNPVTLCANSGELGALRISECVQVAATACNHLGTEQTSQECIRIPSVTPNDQFTGGSGTKER